MENTRTIKTAMDDGTMVITCVGELDLYVGKEFDKALADAVATGQPVTVDFLSADFIDSAILHSLAKHGKTMSDRGDRIKVMVTPGSHPEYVLETVGFRALMDIESVESEEDVGT
jgi:anti-anti-sigma factor